MSKMHGYMAAGFIFLAAAWTSLHTVAPWIGAVLALVALGLLLRAFILWQRPR